jgi:mono/diheme cytochrome c family protein
MAWVTITAHLGGTLVYRHGIGTGSAESAPPATQPAATGQTNSPTATAEQMAFFRDHVAPILAQNCITCHNPRRVAAGKSGKLDQTSRDGLLKGGKSGPAITPGNPDESLLIHRVRGDLPGQDVMPPDGKLTDAQIATLAQWIKDGAMWSVPVAPQPPG